jgi:uncharacterized protein YbjT (DUF2867 family)
MNILLTGASGYIGGRLLPVLLRAGHAVRCLVRQPEALRARVDARAELVAGDVLDPASLARAMQGIHTAYYLVHSMGSQGSFEEADRQGAENFGRAARAGGVRRIIYLGGLGDDRERLSAHLRSRHETGMILRESGVEVLEFRASIVIGSGSMSFEMIRALCQRLPIMTTPKWVQVKAQPIGIADLLRYLTGALGLPAGESRVFEIGGTEALSYADLMQVYCRVRGLRRLIIPVPVLSPRLSSWWLGLVTPLYARVGRKLIDSLRYPTVVRDRSALEVFGFTPMDVETAIRDALRNEDRELAETRWSDSFSAGNTYRRWGGVRFGNRLVDSRSVDVPATAAQAFAPIRRIGGATGWYFANGLWRLRGFLDQLVGGIGLRRGRKHPERLAVGDVIDWWRVEEYVENSRLKLHAEMRLPGRAWLEFEVTILGPQSTRIRQTAIFDPIGWGGLLYWYGVYPLHALVFRGMLRNIARAAARAER